MKRADRNTISNVVDASQPRCLRRRWSDDVKAQVVAASYAPGAVVSEVARRHEILPQQLSAWRSAARDGVLKLPDGSELVATRPSGSSAIQDRSSSSGEASSVLGGPAQGIRSSRREAGQRLTSLVRTSVR
ncbi:MULTISPECIES: transposase [Bradyrhizobium]